WLWEGLPIDTLFLSLESLVPNKQPIVMGVQGGSPLNITCSYECKYVLYEKYWCKWKNSGCKPLIVSEQNQTGVTVGCDKDRRTFTVNFDEVSLTDQGWYWCGVKNEGHYGETYAVYLQVHGGEPQF
uniref:Ig-like domain-containing protein n=1 Tax=Varanus komodoensis TaxID=61221 RepID=A0A8D2JDX1_VARKO